ncbi:MAG: FadR family transcriptional regulator [Actinobacteria bacterium]|nr:FadR family transcriptional regulator [Actinomycetota bacterium]
MPDGPAFEQIATSLRDAIASGALAEGERLPTEVELGRQFGVSRATVREALRLLSADGMVRTAKGTGGGSYVTAPSLDRISERLSTNLGQLSRNRELSLEQFLEARELLETPAARLAARRADAAAVAGLWETIPERPLELPGAEQFARNRDFHLRLVEASGNPLLALSAGPVFSVLQTHLRRHDQSPRDQAEINEHHRLIAAAIAAGDEEGAAAATRRHLAQLRPGYERAWAPGPGSRSRSSGSSRSRIDP